MEHFISEMSYFWGWHGALLIVGVVIFSSAWHKLERSFDR